MANLDGRIALVTGGGRGIGRGISLQLARAGADVAIGDIDLDSAEATQKEIAELGRRAQVVRLDVTDPGSIRAGVDAIVAELGGIDILVNNAGVVQDNLGDDATSDDWDRCYQVNLKGIWAVSEAVVPHFRDRGGGKIVNIASIAGRNGGAGLAPYSASKAGAISLTQSQAQTLGRDNINVNAICPGLLWTPMWQKLEGMFQGDVAPDVVDKRAAFDAFIRSRCPLGREQTPEDIGDAAVFLASDAARNITGQALNVDGGITMN